MPAVPISMRKLKKILGLKYGLGLSHRLIPRRISMGLTARKTFSGVSIFEGSEDIGQLRRMAAHTYPARKKESNGLIHHR